MAWDYPDGTPDMFLPTEDELQHGIKVVHSSRQPTGKNILSFLSPFSCSSFLNLPAHNLQSNFSLASITYYMYTAQGVS